MFFTVQSFGQKWYLNKIDNSKEFPYEYCFQFENLEDSCTFQIIKKTGIKPSTFEFYDKNGNPVIFANVQLINLETDFKHLLTTEINGKTKIQLEKGKYRLEVFATLYDDFRLDFEIDTEQFIELIIKLGLAPELEVYQIDSKTELNEREILEIMNCVKNNKNEYNSNCSDKNKYMIMMQI